jgi:hypothetical protein
MLSHRALPYFYRQPFRSQGLLRAPKVVGEDFLEVFPTIDRVSGQVIEPSSGCVDQVIREELDDETIVVHPACPARKVVVL